MKYIISILVLACALPTAGADAFFLRNYDTRAAALQAAQTALAADPSNEALQKSVTEEQLALTRFDDAQKARFGADWRTVMLNSQLADPDDVIVNIYKVTPFDAAPREFTGRVISPAKADELADFLVTKPTYTAADLVAVAAVPFREGIAARLSELTSLLPSGAIRGVDYYIFRNLHVLKRAPGSALMAYPRQLATLPASMTTADWIDLALQPAPVPAATFVAGREHLMLKATKTLMDIRAAANQPVEGPEFDALLTPILNALNAPKFLGLTDALLAAGIDLGIPTPLNTTGPESVAAVVKAAAEAKSPFTTPWGVTAKYETGLGSVMLVLGKDGYEAWRQQVLIAD